MKKEEIKEKNKGITLIALIITIIILIILAAVTILAITKFDIIDLAIKGAEDFTKEMYKESEEISKIEDVEDRVKGENNGGEDSGIDTKGPKIIIEVITKISAINGKIKAKITIKDDKSGVDTEGCFWTINESKEMLGEDESLYTGGKIESEEKEIETASIVKSGTYYIHVLARDKAGNVTESVSEGIIIKNAYAISTPQDLQNVKTGQNIDYYVVNDIDMAGFNFKRIAGRFRGTIDGGGYTISNLKITNNTRTQNTGIFEYIEPPAKISNLLLKNVNISSSGYRVAPLAGHVYATNGNVTIERVGITGKVTRSR